jgi:hypothetical protein
MEGNVTISKKEYLRLLIESARLNLLECGGVDNWEWYGESLNPDGALSIEEIEEALAREIEQI